MPSSAASQKISHKVRQLLLQHNRFALRRMLARLNFADLSEVMEHSLTVEETVQCFRALTPAKSAQVLISLDDERQLACLLSLSPDKAGLVLRLMGADEAVDILQKISPHDRRRIMGEMPLDSDTRTIHNLLMEAPESAAGIMSTDYVRLSVEATVGEALAAVRRASEKDFIYYVYLTDVNERLVGVLSLRKLIHHEDSVPLQRIATYDIKSILVSFDQEFVANLFRKYYNLLAMPVVDADNVLRGIITLDDVLDVIDEETSEDLYQASGIRLDDIDEKNLLTGPVFNAVKARMPWLSITMFGQFASAMIIASFQETVAGAVIAFSFMPLLCGLSGNMGTQSDTITVRGLALNLVRVDNIREKIGRELKIALTIGSIFSVIVGLTSLTLYRHWELSALLSVSIVLNLCMSGLLGVLLPYVIQRYFKQDPAGVGGPFITTFMDLLTYTTYLFLISLLLDRLI
ncbi:MAG: magnesium transporter [Candidatus Melainabacteria bacterium]|nr:magnesium transporter [Candidatus Melainabacteria bacterium]